ncbi:type I pullulanase [Thomasclavelia sp.]|uniref:type I pullulanase n=1 Tax=Thomasclavelia sp. TaxID=3025757 RepID=UPI002630B14E|nr:type I pullulanase [Thomasclavelia sp.]
MEESAIRMIARMISLNTIEVLLLRKYYGGYSPRFYLRDMIDNSLKEIKINNKYEDAKFIHYYFNEIEIDFCRVYQIVDAYGLSETLQYKKLIYDKDFLNMNYYDGDDLGNSYHMEYTEFKVWAPTALEVKVSITKNDTTCSYNMKRLDKGVFYTKVDGDYDNCSYVYLVRHHDEYCFTVDPYAYSSSSNGQSSIIINLDKIKIDLNRECLDPLLKKTDAIIYEANVRDYTMYDNCLSKYKGKFKGICEEGLKTKHGNSAGLDYLVELGITHLQLMPIQDFATVDENHQKILYNWGYDPAQYNVPEGSYCSNPNDGYSRVSECKEMVSKLHSKGIRVVMDVVYNHVYDINANAFERLVPGYYFRKNPDGSLSNGSWCGNDVDSQKKMVRKYIVDMSKRWQQFYGVDGFRFDLMGIIDIETINEVYRVCSDYDSSFILYGEGWNMPTNLPDSEKAMQYNHDKLLNISFFNDTFREVIKGGSGDSVLVNKGFVTGNLYETQKARDVINGLNCYSRIDQSINYVECHDNATVFDKLYISNVEEGLDGILNREKNLTIVTLLSQGIPFIHAGQEFYRTKGGVYNSYNSLDNINCLNWDFRDIYKEDVDDIKKIIRLRKENKCFRYDSKEDIEKNVVVENIDYKMIKYVLRQDEGMYREFVIYINPSNFTFDYQEKEYECIYGKIDSGKIGAKTVIILAK